VRYAWQTVLVDRELRVLALQPGASTLPLFVAKSTSAPKAGTFVKDAGVAQLRDDYEALSAAHVVVSSLQYDKFGDLVASMRNGVQLLLGDDSLLSKTAPLVGPILSQVGASGRKIAQVDLRAPKTPVVVYKK
jgi:cell division septal protein FtsQ